MSIIDQIVGSAKNNFSSITFDELDEFKDVKNWVSTGIPELDLELNTYGYCPGIIKISGKSRSGKSTVSLHLIKQIQLAGGIALVISTERRDNKDYAERLGIDSKNVMVKKAITIEDSFKLARENILFIRSGAKFKDMMEKEIKKLKRKTKKAVAEIEDKYMPIIEEAKKIPIAIIWDSLGGTPSRKEFEAEEGDDFMAVASRAIKQALRRNTQMFDDNNAIFFVVNQTYSKVGVVFGSPEKTYGGEGMKFHSWLRMIVKLVETLKMGGGAVGQMTRFTILKNDFSLPMRVIDVPMLWGYGFIPSELLLNLGVDRRVLSPYKSGYQVNGMDYKWSTRKQYYDLLMNNKKFRIMLNKILTIMVHKIIRERREEIGKEK